MFSSSYRNFNFWPFDQRYALPQRQAPPHQLPPTQQALSLQSAPPREQALPLARIKSLSVSWLQKTWLIWVLLHCLLQSILPLQHQHLQHTQKYLTIWTSTSRHIIRASVTPRSSFTGSITCVIDRVNSLHMDEHKPADALRAYTVGQSLPGSDTQESLRRDYVVLGSRILPQYLEAFKILSSVVVYRPLPDLQFSNFQRPWVTWVSWLGLRTTQVFRYFQVYSKT